MEKIYYELVDETLYFKKLSNGLVVYIMPKKGYNKTYATFTTKYGSIDNHFGTSNLKKVPDGIAHFLEHKMFETKDGDVFKKFVENGANANAFTSFTRTSYLFSCTKNVNNNLIELLDFVQELYISAESVDKEKGIIEQEIKMYDDDSGWKIYFGLIENMFKNHPVKIDIAGTIESINKITVEDLKYCYDTFYHPSNMTLFIIGDIDENNILKLIEENQSKKKFNETKIIKRKYDDEPVEVDVKSKTLNMDVSIPKVLVGVKENLAFREKDVLKHDLKVSILLDLIFGKSSEFYENLINKKIIDDGFMVDHSFDINYGYIMLGGDSKEPILLDKKIRETLLSIKFDDLSIDDFTRCKKKIIGNVISSFNSLEYLANQFTKFKFEGKDLFDILNVLDDIKFEDLKDKFKLFNKNYISTMTILPKKED